MKLKWIMLILVMLLCSCAKQSKLDTITDPQAYVNELGEQGYSKVYNSLVFEKADKSGKVWTAPFAGIRAFKMPSEMAKAKGIISASGGSESVPGSGLVTVDFNYLALSEEEYKQLISAMSIYSIYAQSNADALQNYRQLAAAYTAASEPLFSVYGIKGNGTADDLKAMVKDIYVKYGGMDESLAAIAAAMMSVSPAGSAGDYSFYLVRSGMADENSFAELNHGDLFEEYQTIYNNIEKYPAAFTFARPLGLTEVNLNDGSIKFETTDLDGKPVKSEDLFSPYKVTMLNIWSTTCSVCLTEIPGLQEMNKPNNPDGAQMVSLLYAGDNPDAAKEARDFLAEYGIDYINIAANDTLKNIFPTQSFPMTYYFDSQGRMIGDPVIGANLKKYEEKLKENLANTL